MKNSALCLFAAFLLSGCAEITIPEPSTSDGIPATIPVDASAQSVSDIASAYSTFLRKVAGDVKRTDLALDEGIIGTALIAAGSLIFAKGGTQTAIVGASGLLAGGLSAQRSRLAPKDVAKLYLQASTQMSCISTTLAPLATVVSRRMADGSFSEVLGEDLAELQAKDTAARDALLKATDETVKKNGDAALTAAAGEISTAARLMDALSHGASYGKAEIDRTLTELESALDGQTVDYASLRDSLVSSAQAKAQSTTDANAAQSNPTSTTAGGGGAVGAESAPAQEDIDAKAAVDELIRTTAKAKQLTDSAGTVQDIKADLTSCRVKTAA